MANLYAKVEVSSFNCSRDMEGVPEFQKSRSRDPLSTAFDLICIICLGRPVANQHAKFEVSSFNHSQDMEGVPKF